MHGQFWQHQAGHLARTTAKGQVLTQLRPLVMDVLHFCRLQDEVHGTGKHSYLNVTHLTLH